MLSTLQIKMTFTPLTLEFLLHAQVDEPFTENLCQLTAEVSVVFMRNGGERLDFQEQLARMQNTCMCSLECSGDKHFKAAPQARMRLCFLLQAKQRRSCLERVADYVSGFSAQLFLQIISKQNSAVWISLRNKL
jgi:hypothetical protein